MSALRRSVNLVRPTASTARASCLAAARSFGGLADEDRIFQNVYGKHDWGIKGAEKRVGLRPTIEFILK